MPRMASAKGERLVAVFEAAKGVLVLLVGFGLLTVVDQDVQTVAEELVRTLHLNPARHLPRIFLEAAERAGDTRLWLLAAFALGYAFLRLAESYGLWYGRRWAEWVAVASGSLYVPLEIYAIWHRASWVKVSTLVVNIAIVAYIGLTLWRRRHGRVPPAGDETEIPASR
jgi:uncharacterized membrane protein (DUF2068 family)